MKTDIDPLEELLAAKKKNRQKYKSLDAYIAHLKALPSPDDILKQLEAKSGKKAERVSYLAPKMGYDKDNDPLEEIRANKREIRKKYKTLDAYIEHLKDVPSVDELLRQVRAKIAELADSGKTTRAEKKPATKKRRVHSKV